MIKLVLVDDHEIVRAGLRRLLENQEDIDAEISQLIQDKDFGMLEMFSDELLEQKDVISDIFQEMSNFVEDVVLEYTKDGKFEVYGCEVSVEGRVGG